jgi:hypothetical protein
MATSFERGSSFGLPQGLGLTKGAVFYPNTQESSKPFSPAAEAALSYADSHRTGVPQQPLKPTPKTAAEAMGRAGFPREIYMHLTHFVPEKLINNPGDCENLIEFLYRRYDSLAFAMRLMGSVCNGKFPVDTDEFKGIHLDAESSLSKERNAEEYNGAIEAEFAEAHGPLNNLLEQIHIYDRSLIELRAVSGQSQLEFDAKLKKAREFLRSSRRSCKTTSISVDALFGYWFICSACDVFFATFEPSMHEKVRDFVETHKRKILGTDVSSKIGSANLFEENIIDQIEDGDILYEHRQVLKDRIQLIIKCYKQVKDMIEEIQRFQYTGPKPVEAVPDERGGVLDVQDIVESQPVAPPPVVDDKPKKPSKAEVNRAVAEAQRKWEDE